MILQLSLFIGLTIATYVGISFFAQITGGTATSVWSVVTSVFRPLPLITLVVANTFFALAVYFGFMTTRFALPIVIALGASVSFAYSIVMFGAVITSLKVLGLVCVVGGIILLGI